MASNLNLEGKVAFITGSTRGIGWATACALAREKATVILNGSRDQTLLERRSREIIERFQVESFGILADAADPIKVKSCYQVIFKRYRRLDILVNNAGVLDDSILGMISDQNIDHTFAVNAIGCIHHLQGASRLMLRSKSGSIVNVTSIVGRNGNSGQVVYGSSKAAVIGMTLSAAKELAEKDIRVNAVAPGFINTDMVKHLERDKYERVVSGITMGRIGTAEEVADVILFLASDLSRYVTGQVIGVDGGLII